MHVACAPDQLCSVVIQGIRINSLTEEQSGEMEVEFHHFQMQMYILDEIHNQDYEE